MKVLDFMEVFDTIQVRYAGAEFRRLIELVARTAQVASKVGFFTARFVYYYVELMHSAIASHIPNKIGNTSPGSLELLFHIFTFNFRSPLP